MVTYGCNSFQELELYGANFRILDCNLAAKVSPVNGAMGRTGAKGGGDLLRRFKTSGAVPVAAPIA